MAQKQAQLLDHEPTTYLITYRGEHTCREPVMVSHIISSASFGTNIHYGNQEAAVPAPPKQESEEETVSNLSSSSSPDYLQLPAAEMPPVMAPTVGHAPNHGDVTHGFQSCADLYLDFTCRYLEDSVLAFDELF